MVSERDRPTGKRLQWDDIDREFRKAGVDRRRLTEI